MCHKQGISRTKINWWILFRKQLSTCLFVWTFPRLTPPSPAPPAPLSGLGWCNGMRVRILFSLIIFYCTQTIGLDSKLYQLIWSPLLAKYTHELMTTKQNTNNRYLKHDTDKKKVRSTSEQMKNCWLLDWFIGFICPLCCLFFFDIQILIGPLVSFVHCVVSSSLIYGFWLALWYHLSIVLSLLLWYTDYDWPFGIFCPLCCLFFLDIRIRISLLVSSNSSYKSSNFSKYFWVDVITIIIVPKELSI